MEIQRRVLQIVGLFIAISCSLGLIHPIADEKLIIRSCTSVPHIDIDIESAIAANVISKLIFDPKDFVSIYIKTEQAHQAKRMLGASRN